MTKNTGGSTESKLDAGDFIPRILEGDDLP